MASYTTSNRLIKQVFNENIDTWGDPVLNSQAIDMIDESLDSVVAVATTGGTTTLTSSNGTTDENRPRHLVLSGVLASNSILRTSAVDKGRWVYNGCTGAFSVTIGVSGGVHATLVQGGWTHVVCDGTDTSITTPKLSEVSAPTANVSMANYKLTNLGDGSNNGDAVNFSQLLAYFSSSNPGLLGVPFWLSNRYR